MEELLYQECWLENSAEGFNMTQQSGNSISNIVYDPSRSVPSLRSSYPNINTQHEQLYQEQITGHRNFPSNTPLHYHKADEHPQDESESTTTTVVQSKRLPIIEGTEAGRGWPISNSRSSNYSVKERIRQALQYLEGYTKDKDVLIQVWMPIKRGGKNFLTTIDQPYFLKPGCKNLSCYRNVAKTYDFPLEENSQDSIGFPGRVFLEKLPDWSPDVRLFRENEYPFRDHARQYNICGCLAIPVLGPSSGTCLGVIEVVTTAHHKISCRPELEYICKALKEVDLKTSQDFCSPSVKVLNELYEVAVPEISEILQSVCKRFRLPLALTWAPCKRLGESGYDEHFPEKFASCILTVDSACFLADKELSGFYKACSEQYIFLGQGTVGKAFSKQKQCFSPDITCFTKTSYPLAHHANIYNLQAAVAFPLRSIYTGLFEFVLELFLPQRCRDPEEQSRMWDLLSISIQQSCRSLQVILDKEIVPTEETDKKSGSSSWIACTMGAQKNGNGCCVSWDCKENEPKEEFKVITNWDGSDDQVELEHDLRVFSELQQLQKISPQPKSISIDDYGVSSSSGKRRASSRKAGEKKRISIEDSISLEVLQQHFAGTLQDAAKSIGVCPTTLKRICRKNGITRWPSRKIKKVDHSLRKLQKVIDSVQGNQGSIHIGSFYSAFPQLSSPKISINAPFSSTMKNRDNSKQFNPPPERAASRSSHSSSCSKGSCSSMCCSAQSHKHTTTINNLSSRSPLLAQNPNEVLQERSCSKVELHALNQEELNIPVRSLVHKTLSNFSSMDTPPPCSFLTNKIGQSLQEAGAFRVKAIFAEEKVRLCLQPNWKLWELRQEIGKRFNLDDFTGIDLKYLDDDGEWVRLNCDADLEECKDIYKYCKSKAVIISLHQASQPILASSLCWRGQF
ncbi:transcription factor, putative [Ricinus communis]|uniref:Transcription factor, putative n=2 Tax=Ricinus communis TaxID=3988 RepID=B9SIH8_RICCO|nr:transcription factor, putative [Ricinus communis]